MKRQPQNEQHNNTLVSSTTSNYMGRLQSEVDAVLASKMRNLSVEERDSGLYDLHGVADKIEDESMEMIQAKIQEMNRILRADASLCNTSGSTITSEDAGQHAYRMAMNMDPNYVDQMKVTCLRAQCYNAEEAASLLKRFFHRKLQLFGIGCLAREITLQDLGPHGETLLRKGLIGLLPSRDRAGRAIIYIDGKVNGDCLSTALVMQCTFYMSLVALRDVETQREGVVIIYYAIDQSRTHNEGTNSRTVEWMYNWNAIPWRNVAFHNCLAERPGHLPGYFRVLSELVTMFQGSKVCRTRFHKGAPMECIYELLTFGIPQDSIPVMPNGERDFSSHRTMLDTIQRREAYEYGNQKSFEQPSSPQQNPIMASSSTSCSGENVLKEPSLSTNMREPRLPALTVDSDSFDRLFEPVSRLLDGQHHTQDDLLEVENLMKMLPPSNPCDEDGTIGHMDHNSNHSNSNNIATTDESLVILVPNPKDVLLGKGRLPKSHQGNMKFHNLLHEYKEIYDSSEKKQKTIVSQGLLEKLQSDGCRFLSHDTTRGGYIVVDDKIARQKVAHGFRNLRIMEERANKKSLSSTLPSKENKKSSRKKKKKNSQIADNNDDTDSSSVSDADEGGKKKKRKNANLVA